MKDTWLTDETIHRQICNLYDEMRQNEKFTRVSMTRALTKVASDSFDIESPNHLYRKQFEGICPYDKSKRRITYYYRSTDGTIPRAPTEASEIDDPYARSHRAREGRHRASENDKAQAHSAEAEEALKKLQESKKKISFETPSVKKSGGDDKPKATPSPVHEKKDTINPDAAKPNKTKAELRDDILDKQSGFDRKDKLLKQTGKLSMITAVCLVSKRRRL